MSGAFSVAPLEAQKDARSYGIVADGTTNNRSGFVTAFAAAVADDAPLYQAGNTNRYRLNHNGSAVSLPDGLRWVGDGADCSVVKYGPDTSVATTFGFTVIDTKVEIENMSFVGPGNDAGLYKSIGFQCYSASGAQGTSRLKFKDCKFDSFGLVGHTEVGGWLEYHDSDVYFGDAGTLGVPWASGSPRCGAYLIYRGCRFRISNTSTNTYHSGSQCAYMGHGTSSDIAHCYAERLGCAGENAFQNYGGPQVLSITVNDVTFYPPVDDSPTCLFIVSGNKIKRTTGTTSWVVAGFRVGQLVYFSHADQNVPILNHGDMGRISAISTTDNTDDTITVDTPKGGAIVADGPVIMGIHAFGQIVRSTGSWLTADTGSQPIPVGDYSCTVTAGTTRNNQYLGFVRGVTASLLDLSGAVYTEAETDNVSMTFQSDSVFCTYLNNVVTDRCSRLIQCNDTHPTTITDCTSWAIVNDIGTANRRTICKGLVSRGYKQYGIIEATGALSDGALFDGCDFGASYTNGICVIGLSGSTGRLDFVNCQLRNKLIIGSYGIRIATTATAASVRLQNTDLYAEAGLVNGNSAFYMQGGGTFEFIDSLIECPAWRGIEGSTPTAAVTYYFRRSKLKGSTTYGGGLFLTNTSIDSSITADFTASTRKIGRNSAGSFVSDGVQVGMVGVVSGSTSNNGYVKKSDGTLSTVSVVTADEVTFSAGAVLVDEADKAGVTVKFSFPTTVHGEQTEFIGDSSAYVAPSLNGTGLIEGWLKFRTGLGPSVASAASVTLNPNYDQVHITGTTTIDNLLCGGAGTVDAKAIFGGGTYYLVFDSTAATSAGGNIKPKSTGARTANEMAGFRYDPRAGFWYEV